jgi:hypothetical protein
MLKRLLIMATLILAGLSLFKINAAYATDTSTPRSIESVIKDILSEKLIFSEQALIYGFISVESCLYKKSGMLILEHYCHPRRSYVARSFTVITKDLSVMSFYEEKFDDGLYRDISLSVFPEDWKAVYSGAVEDLNIASLNKIYEHFSKNSKGGCWSNNNQTRNFGCHLKDASKLENWFSESQKLVDSQSEWRELFQAVEANLVR